MADEEVSDPKALLEERSKAKCVSNWYDYQKCVTRIANDETGQKHCTGQYFDYWQCVDKNCAADFANRRGIPVDELLDKTNDLHKGIARLKSWRLSQRIGSMVKKPLRLLGFGVDQWML